MTGRKPLLLVLGGLMMIMGATAFVKYGARTLAPPVAVRASSSAPGHPASRVLEGRSHAPRAFDWQPAERDEDPWIALTLRSPAPVAAVLAYSEDDPAEHKARLSVDGEDLGAGERGPRARVWPLRHARTLREIRLATHTRVHGVEMIPAEPTVLLVEPSSPCDFLLELLRGYGLDVARLPAHHLGALPLSPTTRVVLGPGALDPRTKAALRRHLAQGGVVLESSPQGNLCAAPSTERGAASKRVFKGPATREPIHVTTRLAEPKVCPDCPKPRPLLASAQGEVLLVDYEQGRGTCLRVMADLAEVMRGMRQGNPANANRDMNGKGGIQPSDLFYGVLAAEDLARPHADLLMEAVLAAIAPPYRLHPIPPLARGVLVTTADQDYVPDPGVLAQAADAQLPVTFLLTDSTVGGRPDIDFGDYRVTRLAAETFEELIRQGHEAGVHPNLLGLQAPRQQSALAEHVRAFQAAYGTRPRVARNHHLMWSGYSDTAEWQARLGIVLDLNFMALAFAGEGGLGFLNGSGFPLRFVREDGVVLPVYQQSTQLDDHVLLPARFGYEPYDLALLIARSRSLIAQSVSDPPHPIVVNHHPAWWFDTKGAWLHALRRIAHEQGLTTLGAASWVQHVEAIRATRCIGLSPGRVRALTAASETALLVRGRANIRLDGSPVSTSMLTLAGVVHTRVALPANRDLLVEWNP